MPGIYEHRTGESLDIKPSDIRWKKRFVVWGFTAAFEAAGYAFVNLPKFQSTAALEDYRVAELIGSQKWIVEASYSTARKNPINKDAATGDPLEQVSDPVVVEYALGAENRNIKKSLATKIYLPGDLEVVDTQGLIGVDKDGVHGVDLAYGLVSFSVTKSFRNDEITPELREKWEELSDPQHLNNATFGPYAAGEVLFTGIGQCRLEGAASKRTPVRFEFQRRKNKTSVAFGPSITIATVKGWQVVEPRFVEKEDATNHILKREIKEVAIHDVYPEADFAELECGL
jgi:hypothetical protein